MNRRTTADTVALLCRKCGRKLIVEREGVSFAPGGYHSVCPDTLIAWFRGAELRCPFHDGSAYWLMPEDMGTELARLAKIRFANRLIRDVDERRTLSPADEDLFWALEEAEGSAMDYLDSYLQMHEVGL